ncbi:hypothetical protein [Streptomyces sp. NPDC057854]|uniref:hypothetical protein n=1 Tax=unclassified Streptomyces TaxID=2593676 RepID=UPI0036B15AD3
MELLQATLLEVASGRKIPDNFIAHLEGLSPPERLKATRWLFANSSVLENYPLNDLPEFDLQNIRRTLEALLKDLKKESSFSGRYFPREELAKVADSSEGTIDHALAMMFIRLGPPPEPTEVDYAPASSGGGGAQQ